MKNAIRDADGRFAKRWSRSLVAVVLIVIHALGLGVGQAQLVQTAGGPQKLMITILDGDGALNNIRQRDAREPIVQVTDENHKPVAGALLLFTIHDGASGAGASFASGATSIQVTTGPDGIAHATGLQAHGSGSFTITVSATLGAVMAAEVILHQTNVIGPPSTSSSSSSSSSSSGGGQGGSATSGGTTGSHSTLYKVLHSTPGKLVVGGVVVGAVVGVLVVTTQNNSTSITLGASTVTHP